MVFYLLPFFVLHGILTALTGLNCTDRCCPRAWCGDESAEPAEGYSCCGRERQADYCTCETGCVGWMPVGGGVNYEYPVSRSLTRTVLVYGAAHAVLYDTTL
jgi:hypothetical protein